MSNQQIRQVPRRGVDAGSRTVTLVGEQESRAPSASQGTKAELGRLDAEGMGVCTVFPVLFFLFCFVLKCFLLSRFSKCVLGCFPKQTDRRWVGPGPQPNNDFMLMIWGSVHLSEGIP